MDARRVVAHVAGAAADGWGRGRTMTTPRSRPRRRAPLSSLVSALVLGVALAGPAPPTGAADPGQARPPAQAPQGSDEGSSATLREEYEQLAGEEAELLLAYDGSTARLRDLLVRAAEADGAKAAADLAVVEAQVALDERRREEQRAEADLAAARGRVARAEERLRRFAVEAYVGEGAVTDLAALLEVLEGDDGSLARQGYRRSLDDQQGELIDALVGARAERRRLQLAAERATTQAQRQRDDVDELRQAAAAALDESLRLVEEAAAERERQQLLLLDVRSRRVAIEARIVSLERAADGIASLLAQVQAADPDWLPGAVTVAMPHAGGRISSHYGMRAHPILPVTRLHAGADIGAPHGAPVLAAAHGVVVLAEERGGYGLTVVVAHGHSLATVYAHCSSVAVQPGDLVERGQEIAAVGSTGLSTGPHIHFETRVRGMPVDPRSFLLPADGGTGVPGPAGDRDVNPFAARPGPGGR